MTAITEAQPAKRDGGRGHMPVNPETTDRKTLNLPKDLVRRVKSFRHQHELDTEAEAYVRLLEKGLEAFEREEREARKKPPK